MFIVGKVWDDFNVGKHSIGMGYGMLVSGDFLMVMGVYIVVDGDGFIVIGSDIMVSGLVSIVIGDSIKVVVIGESLLGIGLVYNSIFLEIISFNIMVIMGGKVGIGIISLFEVLEIKGNLKIDGIVFVLVIVSEVVNEYFVWDSYWLLGFI